MIYTNENHPDSTYENKGENMYIGYWKNERFPELPDPNDFIDDDWDQDEKERVLRYIKNGEKNNYFLGSSRCRICGCSNGSSDMTDGFFVWPEGFAHYVEVHNLKPSAIFIKYIESN